MQLRVGARGIPRRSTATDSVSVPYAVAALPVNSESLVMRLNASIRDVHEHRPMAAPTLDAVSFPLRASNQASERCSSRAIARCQLPLQTRMHDTQVSEFSRPASCSHLHTLQAVGQPACVLCYPATWHSHPRVCFGSGRRRPSVLMHCVHCGNRPDEKNPPHHHR